ncbi:hypothetical protein LCGC14_1444230 [marine sediment metagenome]|uniref:Cupin type-2 domain-containing protein n=1 Tax=marine sediment metagenome TaxID=412755 RepID=A0A0F9JJQ1_9ZZZZ
MQEKIYKYDLNKEYFFVEGCFINELLNDGTDPDVSIAQARVTPGMTTAWHYLSETTERYVILQGHGEVSVGSELKRNVTVGDIVVIPQEIHQCIKNIGSADLVFLAICSPRFKAENYREVS